MDLNKSAMYAALAQLFLALTTLTKVAIAALEIQIAKEPR
jgi:hypothetical protein